MGLAATLDEISSPDDCVQAAPLNKQRMAQRSWDWPPRSVIKRLSATWSYRRDVGWSVATAELRWGEGGVRDGCPAAVLAPV